MSNRGARWVTGILPPSRGGRVSWPLTLIIDDSRNEQGSQQLPDIEAIEDRRDEARRREQRGGDRGIGRGRHKAASHGDGIKDRRQKRTRTRKQARTRKAPHTQGKTQAQQRSIERDRERCVCV